MKKQYYCYRHSKMSKNIVRIGTKEQFSANEELYVFEKEFKDIAGFVPKDKCIPINIKITKARK